MSVLDLNITGYNGAAGPIEASAISVDDITSSTYHHFTKELKMKNNINIFLLLFKTWLYIVCNPCMIYLHLLS